MDDTSALLEHASCVLFDFDGPLADLFAGHPASRIAHRLRRRAERLGVPPEELPVTDDPLRVLRLAARGDRTGRIAAELDEQLTREEVYAARTAPPVPHADRLVERLVASGRQVAVTTNNSARAALAYLQRRALAPYFGSHIHGRAPDPELLKPHTDCLERAVAATGTSPAHCLMIGDAPSDLAAAASLGLPFVGYARNERKAQALREAGAAHIVRSLADLSPSTATARDPQAERHAGVRVREQVDLSPAGAVVARGGRRG
ncbi:HAD-IA family hydrolase [Streptomyces sp. ME01-24h]|nr:HAD-IA family hydrolase [Streptomyces sp. ME02-6991-2B]MDX3354566.1 HAD-IA family hydrolase [Streptomyces sp. ME01-24h]